MSLTPGNDPNGERLEEFRFLFSDLQHASLVHPPRNILEEYVRGIRPEGTDSQGWQSHAISAHVGICHSCQLQVGRLRQKQQASQFARGARRWRPAYQYLGIVLLIGGLILIYSLVRNSTQPFRVGPGGDEPGSGLAFVSCEATSIATELSKPQLARLRCEPNPVYTEASRSQVARYR